MKTDKTDKTAEKKNTNGRKNACVLCCELVRVKWQTEMMRGENETTSERVRGGNSRGDIT